VCSRGVGLHQGAFLAGGLTAAREPRRESAPDQVRRVVEVRWCTSLARMPLPYEPDERWVCSFAHHVQAYLVE